MLCCALGHCKWSLSLMSDFSVTPSVTAFGRGTGYSALSNEGRLGLVELRETRCSNYVTMGEKSSIFFRKSPATRRTWTYKNVDYCCCIVIFVCYNCRPSHLANVLRLAHSATRESRGHAHTLPCYRCPFPLHLSVSD